MAKLNPIDEAKFIEQEYRQYLKSTFRFDDEKYQKQFEDELDKTILYKGPYINLNLPFETGNSINELIDKGIASAEFRKLSGIKLDQKLYLHQEESFRKISAGRNVVITTGTGSGKTESFLYPILNSIMREIENNENNPGVRAIFLYPMNALVNDQMSRVRKILKDYPDIKYGFFTGDTEEKGGQTLRDKIEKENGEELPENELVTREEIRAQLPHLLFTNYSMLEYLLIRPTDYKLFETNSLNSWRYVVLDEAHTYNGALGIEVALLLRRLTGMAKNKPQFILTSATLGEKGKSEDDIIKFAKALTSLEYTREDIIFSTRKKLDYSNIIYKIDPNDYIELDKNINNGSKIKVIANKYIQISEDNSPKGIIYDVLIRDKNLYKMYELLKDKSKKFDDLFDELKKEGFSKEGELIAFIHLINVARKDNLSLYETKYHTFVRALAGAYVTLNPQKNLRLKNYYSIDDLKTFELGNCRYCNASFIMGKTINSREDGLDYLYQNSDVDIYENYDDAIDIRMEYYLITDSIDNSIDIDLKNCVDRIVCSKCGHIYDPTNLNAVKCKCGQNYEVKLYKVNCEDMKNNISECPCCHHNATRGIVRALNLGKDEATTILSQILFQAIDDNEEVSNNTSIIPKSFSFFGNNNKTSDNTAKEKGKSVKQFITFSDSRQQASFFASFYDYSYKRFIRKRLLWNELEQNNHESIDFSSLIVSLTNNINQYKLFKDDNKEPVKQAWVTALMELLNVDGNYGAEGLGLFYFKLKINEVIDVFTNDQLHAWKERYNLNKEELGDLICVLFDCVRRTSCINYEKSELTKEEKDNELEYRRFNNYIKFQKGPKSCEKNIYSFVPTSNNGNNNQLDYIMRVLKEDRNKSVELLRIIFEYFGVKAGLLQKDNTVNDEVYQIKAYKYELCSYKNGKYYICNKCGKLTPYNVKGVCPTLKCEGVLTECNPEENEILKNNYYRNQYKNKKIEPMIIKEHTAQIDRKTAKLYQNEFKNKKINILSCSTTFEMGVDIGDLETVFMRNVPPTPANYVQRAGRAGRRDDSSSFVLTFCSASSHDYTYYDDPNKMISGTINPPKFTVTNEKIILRHLMAASMGFFFRKYPDAYKNVETLVCNGGIEQFYNYIESKPEELNQYINSKVLDKEIYGKYCNFNWYKLIRNSENYAIDNFKNEVLEDIAQYERAINQAILDEDYRNAEYYKGQIKRIKGGYIIQELSRYNIIPKYGFPVDSVNLKIYRDGRATQIENLNRDLSVAISEYAPESEIIANKEKFTSRYITIPRGKELTKYFYYQCENCERYNVSEFSNKLVNCEYCGMANPAKVDTYFIEPIYGFKNGKNESSRNKKPKKSYSGEKIYLGDSNGENKVDISDVLSIETTSDDKLLVMNLKDFYMCKTCGYAEVTRGGAKSKVKEHLNYLCKECENKELVKLNIGHEFKTDVAKIKLKIDYDYPYMMSFLFALLEGISTAFNIERKDIDGVLSKNSDLGYDIVLFDNVPGGAGHTKRLANKEEFVHALEMAYQKVNQNCCDENTSCYNCLRNFNNQKYHKLLRRKDAKEIIKEILKSIK